MSDINPSVWNQDLKGEWKLYFNTNTESISPIVNIEQSKLKHNYLQENSLILGTLVMTPKGMGRYIKNNKGLCTVRFEEESKEEEFEINKLSNTFNCFLTELSNDNINIIRFKLKVIGKVEDILNELEKLKKINKEENDYSLIYQGKVLKNDFTFEQLNILDRWENNNPVNSLAVPIGVDQQGELFKMDIHEKYHGPHGLVAGTTGSGK